MCVWAGGHCLGDITEPGCMLNVTEGKLQSLLKRMDSLEDPALCDRADRDAFEFLDHALYLDNGQSFEQVQADSCRFRKFDFLTNGGESFDRTKSFVIADGDRVRLLFKDDRRGFASAHIDRDIFVRTIQGFLAWVAEEGKNAV